MRLLSEVRGGSTLHGWKDAVVLINRFMLEIACYEIDRPSPRCIMFENTTANVRTWHGTLAA